MTKRKTTKSFIKKATEIHGGTYDYTEVVYINSKTNVTIGCTAHGSFQQAPSNHLRGTRCPTCSGKKKHSTSSFIAVANKVHKSKYIYSEVVYVNNSTKVVIICKKHGRFEQVPNNHLNESKCVKCSYELRGKQQCKTSQEFIVDAEKVHGDTYDYSEVIYKKYMLHVNIKCHTHGIFKQTPRVHLRGHGCRRCHQERTAYEIYKNKPTILYVVDFGIYKGIPIIKIGVTQQGTTSRFRYEVTKPKVVKEVKYKDGWDAFEEEQRLLDLTSSYLIHADVGKELLAHSGGHTELRHKDALSIIEKELKNAKETNN